MAEGGGGQKEAPLSAGASGSGTSRIVEGSIVRPTGQTHRRVEGGRQHVPQQPSGQSGNWFDQEMPYEELVGNIRVVVERARAKHPKNARKPFNTAEWLGEELLVMAREHHEGEDHKRYRDLSLAWDALAYTRYTSGEGAFKWSEIVRQQLEHHVQDTNQTSLTLPPQSVKVIDAMGEVAGIPRKQGESTIDLSPFSQRDTWRQEDNWFEPKKPYEELLEDMRALVQQGRADYSETDTEPFNPAAWLGWYLQGLAEREAVGQQRYGDVKTAWDALAYTYYPAEGGAQRDRELARWQLEGYVSYTNHTSLNLPPESAKVIDAMAEVAGIPRKSGEATIDLTPFGEPSGNNQSPTPEK